MKLRKPILILVIIYSAMAMMWCRPANADSSDEEVQLRCDPEKIFAVMPYFFGGLGDTLDPQYIQDGWTRVATSQMAVCKVGRQTAMASIHIYAPVSHNCQGGGFAYLDALSLGGRPLIEEPLEIDAARGECTGSGFNRFQSLTLTRSGTGVDLKICRQRDPNPDDLPPICEKQSFNTTKLKLRGGRKERKASSP